MKPTIQLIAHRPAVCTDRLTIMQLLVRVLPPVVRKLHRPPLSLALAIDRSGSMQGEPLAHAKQAATMLVDKLGKDDLLGVVAFDHEAEVVVPLQGAGNKQALKARIDSIEVGGSTDLHQGWLEACRQQSAGRLSLGLSRTIVLSDGMTNCGIQDTARICAQVSDWQVRGVGTSAVGLGLYYNEKLLSEMATAGGGNFFHAHSSSALPHFFEAEFQGFSLTYGSQAELRMECGKGVELLKVFNQLPRKEDGSVTLTDLVYGYPKDLIFEFCVQPSTRARDLCRAVLSYTDRESRLRCCVSETLRLPLVSHGQLVEFPVNPVVMQKRGLQLAGKGLSEAQCAIANGDYQEAKERLQEALCDLREVEPSSEVESYLAEVKSLLENLERREYRSVQKRALAGSTSLSSSSITLVGGPISVWLKLPPHERTQEKLADLLRDEQPGS